MAMQEYTIKMYTWKLWWPSSLRLILGSSLLCLSQHVGRPLRQFQMKNGTFYICVAKTSCLTQEMAPRHLKCPASSHFFLAECADSKDPANETRHTSRKRHVNAPPALGPEQRKWPEFTRNENYLWSMSWTYHPLG